MNRSRIAHTADLDSAELAAIRGLLCEGIDDMTEPDYEHCLGGLHATVDVDGELVGHASVIQRRLLHEGRCAARRLRRGCGRARRTPAPGHRRGDDGRDSSASSPGLTTSARWARPTTLSPFYLGRGWRLWSGTASVVTPAGLQRSADDEGWIYVLPGGAPLPVTGDLACGLARRRRLVGRSAEPAAQPDPGVVHRVGRLAQRPGQHVRAVPQAAESSTMVDLRRRPARRARQSGWIWPASISSGAK